MPSRSAIRTAAAAALLGAALGGCADHFQRRDTITWHSGEAMATNRVTMMVDPWPRAASNKNIAFNGERAAKASERYRTGKVIPPVNPTTSSAAYQGPPPDPVANNTPAASSGPGGSTSPVK